MLQAKSVLQERQEINVNRFEEIDLDISFKIDSSSVSVVLSKPPSLVWDQQSSVASILETEEATITVSVESVNPSKIIHEIVALCLSRDRTDVAIIETMKPPFHPERLKFLHMTPDFLIKDDSGKPKFFCELGTNRSRFSESARIDFDSKNSDLITKLSGAGSFIDASTIIVFAGGIMTNLDFSDQEAQILCSVFMFAQRVHSKLCETYYLHESNDQHDLTFWISQFEASMSKYNLPEQSVAPTISQQMVDHWLQKKSELNLPNVIKSLATLSLTKLKKEGSEWVKTSSLMYAENEVNLFKEKISLLEIRNDRKSPFQIPYIEIHEFTGDRPVIISDEPTLKIWNEVFDQGFPEVAVDSAIKVMKEGKAWEKSSNRAFGKRLVPLLKRDIIDLSITGLFGKQFKEKLSNNLKHLEDKKSFDLSADIQDIEQFMSNTDYWFNKGSYWDPVYDEMEDLLDFARSLNLDTQRESKEKIKNFSRTRLGKYARLLTVLAQELNLSIAKKTKHDEFVFRRISNLDIYIIAKPTGTHLFYSICYKGIASKKPFKEPMYENSGFCFTEFVSTDRNRITSMLNCYENLMLLYNNVVQMDIEESDHESIKSRQKTLFCFGMMLENKQLTADIIYLTRYAYMKVTSGNHFSNPLCLLQKIDQMRSRFAVYIVTHFITAFTMMAEKLPKRIEPTVVEKNEEVLKISSDLFENLIDFISLSQENSFENVINSTYFGTYHSYATMDNASAERKVVSKLITLELEMRAARDDHMWKNSQYGNHLIHEFNLDVSLAGSKLRRQNLERVFKDQTDNMIFRQFKSIMTTSYLEFCSYKASMIKSNEDLFQGRGPESKKAVINVLNVFDRSANTIFSPYSDMDEFFKNFFTVIHAKVNKKNDQPTGLREILTMDMTSRMGLKIIESLLEWMNSYSESETLSKGNRKEQILKSFNQEVQSKLKEGFIVVTLKCSIDHEKWCQFFVMTKFASGLADLLPPSIFKFVCMLLNLITNKRIYLSKDLLMSFYKNPNIKGFDESINELKEQFLGRSVDNDLIDENGAYLKNRSNMGQGWLQNTSGGDGDADVMLNKLIATFIIKTAIKAEHLGKDTQLISNAVDSSDDQGYQFALIIKEEDKKRAIEYLTLIGMVPEVVSHESNKRMGRKKTEDKHRQDIIEFNQLFQSGNSQFVGLTKFNKSSLELPVTLNMADRFSNLSNTRRNILENGGDHSHVDLCQELQAIMHYRSLGCGIDPLFKSFSNNLLEKPHHNFGLFLFEVKEICGLLGNDLSRYVACRNEQYCKLSRSFLKSSDIVMGIDGQKGPMVRFRVVNTDVFKNFSKGHKQTDNFFDINPHVLYLGAESRMEMRELIVEKILDPASELSFTYESTAKVFQASYMFLRQPILKYSDGLDKSGKRVYKSVNIFFFMDEILTHDICNQEELHVMFPRWELYDKVLESIKKVESFNEIRSNKVSRSKVIYNFDILYSTPKISMFDCVKEIWFGRKTKHNRTLVSESFQTYKQIFPWLKDTHNQTFNESRSLFENVEQLYSSIVSMNDAISNPKILCSLKPTGVIKMIENGTKFNWKRTHLLMPKDGSHGEKKDLRDLSLLTRICLTMSGPFRSPEKLELITQVGYMPFNRFTMERNRTIKNLSLASQVIRGDYRDMMQKIAISKDSIIFDFINKQYKNHRGEWVGDCMAMMMVESSVFRISLYKERLTVMCRTKVELNMHRIPILKELGRLQWDKYMVKGGLRFSRSGLHHVEGELGFSYSFQPNAIFEMNLSGRDMYVEVTHEGKVFIKRNTDREVSTILSFHFDLRDLTHTEGISSSEDGLQRNWFEDKPFTALDLMSIKEFDDEELTKWLKFMFCKKMDYRTGKTLGADLFAKKAEEEDFFVYDEDEFPIFQLDFGEDTMKVLEDMKVQPEDGEMPELGGFLVDDQIENNIMYHANLKESVMVKHMVEKTHCFDNIINELQFLSIDQLYLSKFKLPITTSSVWFQIFTWLTDYDSREMAYSEQLGKMDFFSTDGIYAFGEVNILALKEMQTTVELLGYKCLYPTSDQMKMAKGFYMFHSGKKEVIPIKSWKKDEKKEEIRAFLIKKNG